MLKTASLVKLEISGTKSSVEEYSWFVEIRMTNFITLRFKKRDLQKLEFTKKMKIYEKNN